MYGKRGIQLLNSASAQDPSNYGPGYLGRGSSPFMVSSIVSTTALSTEQITMKFADLLILTATSVVVTCYYSIRNKLTRTKQNSLAAST